MTTPGVTDRETKAAEYLQSLYALTQELENAMQAIAHNALPELEESIANQQALSARLGELAGDLCVPLNASPTPPSSSIDDRLKHQIRDANGKLQLLNRRYAALLQHSSRSITMLASLFASFTGQIQEASGPRLKHQTWSCQV